MRRGEERREREVRSRRFFMGCKACPSGPGAPSPALAFIPSPSR